MSKSADKIFAEQVLALMEEYKQDIVLSVKKHDKNHLDAEVRIPQLGKVGFHVSVVTTSQSHSEEDPDPRGFGDTQAVVERALKDWYPGKMNHWTESKRVVTIEAWNLPSERLTDYSATYNYDPTNCHHDYYEGYHVDKIVQLLENVQKTQEYRRKEEQDQQFANEITTTFSRLKRN